VYGTLKRGCRYHCLLRTARLLGGDRLDGLRLYDLGAYPGAVPAKGSMISVEVYEILGADLSRLDRLEDFRPLAPARGLYNRELRFTRFGLAWIYLYNHGVVGKRWIRSGRW